MNILDNVGNFVESNVVGTLDAASLTVTLENSTFFPDPTAGEYNIVCWNATDYSSPGKDPYKEIFRVTSKVGSVFGILRGQEGTAATVKNIDSKIYKVQLSLTAKTIKDIDNNIFEIKEYTKRNNITVTDDYTILPENRYVVVDATDRNISLIAPRASELGHKEITIIRRDFSAYTVTLYPSDLETIDGAAQIDVVFGVRLNLINISDNIILIQ